MGEIYNGGGWIVNLKRVILITFRILAGANRQIHTLKIEK
jgi:hypothetical protein